MFHSINHSPVQNLFSLVSFTIAYTLINNYTFSFLDFLELPWDEKLLKYGTDSSRTDQLVHNNSLDAWSKANSLLSEEHIEFMNENCLALKQLGYLTDEIPPNYATICNI
ncbi:Protein-tyrosine sulfotransferase 1 [Schistosoma haematobium]|uniref:Protein-tyrosine sulfotransferase 1 n=1 Tax=Schistosoma haematobium TaxID=6185 RepID=A0A922LI93_SCHHA|nr:Protein-tyrosine sulfotransferase 1 [Schistosoma haematobium]KAH9585710.1 Protein-tyrosine sulfotransferase 1 [Schistosoma haematobium]